MAFTPQDLAAVDSAIASGELTVRTADGKLVTLRSVSELLQARQFITAEVAKGNDTFVVQGGFMGEKVLDAKGIETLS